MSRPSKELIAEFFPGTELRAPVEGTQSLCSTGKLAVFSAGSLSTHGETTYQLDPGA